MVERSNNSLRPRPSMKSITIKSTDSAEYIISSPLPKDIIENAKLRRENDSNEGEELELNSSVNRIEELLHILNYTISRQEERIDAIDNLCNEFDHFDKARHDKELHLNAAAILFQKLTFAIMAHTCGGDLLSNNPSDIGHRSCKLDFQSQQEEIALICCALEMVYRGSRAAVQESMNNIGMGMVPVLSQLLNHKAMALAKIQVSKSSSIKNSRSRHEETRDELSCDDKKIERLGHAENVTRAIVASVIKILRSFARAGNTAQKRCILNQKDLLSTVFGIITLRKYNKNCRTYGDAEIVADALSTIAFLAEDNDECNSHMILTLGDTKGLINVILWTASNDTDGRVRTQAAFAIMNLVKVPRCRLSENQQTQLLDTLLALFDDSNEEPRKYAGAALFNLACSQEYNFLLVVHQNGLFLDALIRILRKDHCVKNRSNAAWVVFYIFSGQSKVAQILENHCELLDALADVVCYDESLVKVPAAKALRKLSEIVTASTPCHDALLAALVKSAEGGNKSC